MRMRRAFFRAILSYSVCSVVLAVVLAEFAFHPARKPVNALTVQMATPKFGAMLQEVSVGSVDGIKLKGWFARPSHPNGDAIILLHGVGDNRQGMSAFAVKFLAGGYAVLMPDSCGHGASSGFATCGIKESDDVRLWYEWLRTHDNPGCVFANGESMGAAILLQASRRVPFCAIVAESPFASFRQIAFIRVGQFVHTGSWLGKTLLRPVIELAFLYGWLTHGVWLSDSSPETAATMTHVPILLVHGLADDNIPARQSEMILSQNANTIALWEVPNAGHCGASTGAGHEFDERVVAWFATHRSRSFRVKGE